MSVTGAQILPVFQNRSLLRPEVQIQRGHDEVFLLMLSEWENGPKANLEADFQSQILIIEGYFRFIDHGRR